VRVHVLDGLAGVTAGVEDHSVPTFGDAFRYRYFVRLRRNLGKHTIVGGDFGQVAVVIPRNHQNMSRRLGIYVAECERARAFKHKSSRHLARRDSAE
jgi:hypothetical protein